MTSIKRIGILTGGGDCPGLNAVIRAVAKDAMHDGHEVVGILDGFQGLIEDRVRPLEYDDVSNILTIGGTILGSSNRADPSRYFAGRDADGKPIFEDRNDDCVRTLERHGIDALFVIGGDGTMSGAKAFIDRGVKCIGLPKTIDNDLVGTELTFGHLTAVQIATDALDRVHTTAASHHRIMVVEVMGRNAGWIALSAGIASGSDAILIPEIPFTIDALADLADYRGKRGRRFTIICCAEGAAPKGRKQIVDRTDDTSPDPIRLGGVAKWVADELEDVTGIESRHVVLGHVQRGGTPIAQDRVLSTMFGDHAMNLLREGKFGRLVAMQNGRLTDAPMGESAHRQRTVQPDEPLLAAARAVYTSFGQRE